MKTGWRRFAVAIGCVLAAAVGGGAQSAPVEEELVGSDRSMDVRALGLAGATVSRARGIDAAVTNPAGLAALTESELQASASFERASMETRYGRWNTDDSRSAARLGLLGLAYRPVSMPRLGIGFVVNQVRALDRPFLIDATEIEGDFDGFALVEDRETRGALYAYTVSAGVEVAPGMRVGVGVDVWDGTSTSIARIERRDVRQVDSLLDAVLLDDRVERRFDATRVRIGGELGIVPALTIGGTVVLASDVDIREDWRQFTRLTLDDGSIDSESNPGSIGGNGYQFHLPTELSGGATVRVDRLRLSASVRYVDWRDAEYSRAPAGDVSPTQFAGFYTDALEGAFGAEWAFAAGATARAGVRVGSTPIEWKSVIADPWALSFGFTAPLALDLMADVAYTLSSWDREDNELSEKLTSHNVVTGVRLVF